MLHEIGCRCNTKSERTNGTTNFGCNVVICARGHQQFCYFHVVAFGAQEEQWTIHQLLKLVRQSVELANAKLQPYKIWIHMFVLTGNGRK